MARRLKQEQASRRSVKECVTRQDLLGMATETGRWARGRGSESAVETELAAVLYEPSRSQSQTFHSPMLAPT